MNKEELSQILYALKTVFGDDGILLFQKLLDNLKL
jgi:hypothetical protein